MSSRATQVYEFGAFRLDVGGSQLLRGTNPVALAPKIYETLLILVENAGSTVSKEELMHRLWPNTFVEESSLSQNIHQLRKALCEAGAEVQYIETISKRGYRFAVSVSVFQKNGERIPASHQPHWLRASINKLNRSSANRRGTQYLIPLIGVAISVLLVLALTTVNYVLRQAASGPPAEGQAPIATGNTKNRNAYEAYIRGRYFWNKRSGEGYQMALKHFQEAIEFDPGYSLAYSGLADCYLFLALDQTAETSPEHNYERARAAATRAMELNDGLAEAYTTLAAVLSLHDRDWPAAERAYKQAIQANPNYPTAHHWYAWDLLASNRAEEALVEMVTAQELDPLSININAALGQIYYYTRWYEEAISQLKRTLELDASNVVSRSFLAMTYEQVGKPAEALGEYQRVLEHDDSNVLALGGIAHAMAVMRNGRSASALTRLKNSGNTPQIYYQIAAVYVAIGDREEAFRWLEKINDKGIDNVLIPLKYDPRLDQLRQDELFDSFLAALVKPPS
ncbi:MAG TPA: tetratricopeptide repeat protein [Pyrinomonadaceae bacterium]|nr:tetratricopeptide repeat protein [Pyrinomonadaceae bacterium]